MIPVHYYSKNCTASDGTEITKTFMVLARGTHLEATSYTAGGCGLANANWGTTGTFTHETEVANKYISDCGNFLKTPAVMRTNPKGKAKGKPKGKASKKTKRPAAAEKDVEEELEEPEEEEKEKREEEEGEEEEEEPREADVALDAEQIDDEVTNNPLLQSKNLQ